MTASSEERGRELSVRLRPDQFEKIFQLTKEASNLSDARLAEVGWTSAQVDDLMTVALAVTDRLADASGVWIKTLDREHDNGVHPADLTSGIDKTEGVSGEICAVVERSLMEGWRVLTNLLISIYSQRELFLRTGYSSEEIQAAVQSLPVSGK